MSKHEWLHTEICIEISKLTSLHTMWQEIALKTWKPHAQNRKIEYIESPFTIEALGKKF